MALPNPINITAATRFRPISHRAKSRSPSRSPRKAQFTAQQLDPLLSNLSPDSTLKALQATETIPGGAGQDILTQSIADASPSEREIGIRAAFAAQKLREMRNDISKWLWPNKKERGFGAGFLRPDQAKRQISDSQEVLYIGFLPQHLVQEYHEQVEDMRDIIDTLDIEEIKDHVLAAHSPGSFVSSPSPRESRLSGINGQYGRMRDFTALITATVIQALPDLAYLNILLDTWETRLSVLKQIPYLLEDLTSVSTALQSASELVKHSSAESFTPKDFESMKESLGIKVTNLGRRVDKLLDLLEGCEDSLPQTWIDSLERYELEYATWVVEAEHIAMQNELSRSTLTPTNDSKTASSQGKIDPNSSTGQPGSEIPLHDASLSRNVQFEEPIPPVPLQTMSTKSIPNDIVRKKPSLSLNVPKQSGHRRGVSEVSMAESALSTFSDISNAEIVDARSTVVLPSPKVSVVENPFRLSGDELKWFGNGTVPSHDGRPAMLQRASTASIEVVPKAQLKRVTLSRGLSVDLKSQTTPSPDNSPTRAYKKLTGEDATPTTESKISSLSHTEEAGHNPSDLIPSPLALPRSRSKSLSIDGVSSTTPALPRRSSKRNSVGSIGLLSMSSDSPISPVDTQSQELDRQPIELGSTRLPKRPSKGTAKNGSLEAKIQNILTSLPTKVRMATDDDTSDSSPPSSEPNTRSSTPMPSLKLSPVKTDQTARRGGNSDTDVRVFHLTRSGQSRDAPPIKLFVRAVGENGERVMVRVGGGWADLAEYLKEYSAHHGHRSMTEGKLEVASFPKSNTKDTKLGSPNLSSGPFSRASTGFQVQPRSRTPSGFQTETNTHSTSEIINPKIRNSTAVRPSIPSANSSEAPILSQPPVPLVPSSHETSGAETSSGPPNNGLNDASIIQSSPEPSMIAPRDVNGNALEGTYSSTTMVSPGVTTTTTVFSPQNKYTPLGAAGPKPAGKRASTYGAGPTSADDAWVEGMVGKARAVSGNGSSSIYYGPTTTTTTTVTSPTPSSRRASALGFFPSRSPSIASPGASDKDSPVRRSKSRLSLGDVSGIKRVFLRKKSEK